MKPLIMKGGNTMLCPVCQKAMWDNRNKKTNPKQPDFRCKDENCCYSYNPDTGEYEDNGGEFQTAVWLTKEVNKVEKEMQESIKPTPKTIEKSIEKLPDLDPSIRSMLMSYAKDLVCLQIETGKYTEPLGIEDVISAYKQMVDNL